MLARSVSRQSSRLPPYIRYMNEDRDRRLASHALRARKPPSNRDIPCSGLLNTRRRMARSRHFARPTASGVNAAPPPPRLHAWHAAAPHKRITHATPVFARLRRSGNGPSYVLPNPVGHPAERHNQFDLLADRPPQELIAQRFATSARPLRRRTRASPPATRGRPAPDLAAVRHKRLDHLPREDAHERAVDRLTAPTTERVVQRKMQVEST